MKIKIESGKKARAQRVVIYGPEGIGKSTLAATAPAPLFLDTERGSGHLRVDRFHVEGLDDLRTALGEVMADLKAGVFEYKTLVIDTADNLWRYCADAVCAVGKKEHIEDFGYGRGYAMAFDRFRRVLETLDRINRAGVHVVIVCHAKVDRISPPDSAEYSKYCIKVSAPNKQAETARELLKEWCDALLFCRYDVTVNSEQRRAVGTAERVIATSSAPAWEAKNRFGLPEALPMVGESLAPIWGGSEQPVAAESAPVAAEQVVCPSSPEERTSSVYAEATPLRSSEESEEDELLVAYFRAVGKLGDGQGLDALPPAVKKALESRREAALEKARTYMQNA